MIGREKAAKLRQARTSLVISLFSAVVFLFAWIIQVWRYGSYWMALPMFGGASFIFFIMFLKFAPLCSDCKKRPWGIFSRTAICCFAEKVSLRKAVQRTLKTFAVLYIVGGIIAIYIRPISKYGQIATKYLEEQTRRPSLERFMREEKALRLKLAQNPQDKNAQLELGWLYYQANKLTQANQMYSMVAKMDPENPDTEAMLLQAIILGELRKTLQEEKTYERLLELQPENTEALINIGLVYMRNKLVPRAVEQLEKAKKVLLENVKREQKKLERASEDDDDDDVPLQDPPDLVNLKKHLGMCCYHLAVASQLLNEKAKSGQYLNEARRYGVNTSNFSDAVDRFRR